MEASWAGCAQPEIEMPTARREVARYKTVFFMTFRFCQRGLNTYGLSYPLKVVKFQTNCSLFWLRVRDSMAKILAICEKKLILYRYPPGLSSQV